jgi:hypothetical protein
MAGTEARDQHLRHLAAYDRLLAEQLREVRERIAFGDITERLAITGDPAQLPEVPAERQQDGAEPEAGQ